jgi:hypothetical protein
MQTDPIQDSWRKIIPALAAGGLAGILIYAAQFSSGEFALVVGTGLLVAGASAFAGGVLGFLFAIPRTIQGTPAQGATGQQYKGNTNLEEISDWLTKILVGVGLVQIGRAPGALGRLAAHLKPGFGGTDSSAAFALAVMIFFAVVGFLYTYLWTRIYGPKALHEGDLVEQVTTKVQAQLDEQGTLQVNALTIVDRQLKPETGAPSPSQDELNAAVAKASNVTRVEIFQKAESQRRLNWRPPGSKQLMELTIPVFRALIAADTDKKYHRNHGELGFALKDQVHPDYAQAEQELDTAIAIRGTPASQKGWAAYEANRAFCKICQDPGYTADPKQPATADVRTSIEADLKVAAEDSFARTLLGRSDIRTWLTLNGLPLDAGVPGNPIAPLDY